MKHVHIHYFKNENFYLEDNMDIECSFIEKASVTTNVNFPFNF